MEHIEKYMIDEGFLQSKKNLPDIVNFLERIREVSDAPLPSVTGGSEPLNSYEAASGLFKNSNSLNPAGAEDPNPVEYPEAASKKKERKEHKRKRRQAEKEKQEKQRKKDEAQNKKKSNQVGVRAKRRKLTEEEFSEQIRFQCPNCPQKFRLQRDVLLHFVTVHKGVEVPPTHRFSPTWLQDPEEHELTGEDCAHCLRLLDILRKTPKTFDRRPKRRYTSWTQYFEEEKKFQPETLQEAQERKGHRTPWACIHGACRRTKIDRAIKAEKIANTALEKQRQAERIEAGGGVPPEADQAEAKESVPVQKEKKPQKESAPSVPIGGSVRTSKSCTRTKKGGGKGGKSKSTGKKGQKKKRQSRRSPSKTSLWTGDPKLDPAGCPPTCLETCRLFLETHPTESVELLFETENVPSDVRQYITDWDAWAKELEKKPEIIWFLVNDNGISYRAYKNLVSPFKKDDIRALPLCSDVCPWLCSDQLTDLHF